MTTIQQVKEVLQKNRPILQKKGITEIGIFGSYLRGEARPDSDIDILIDITRPAKIDLLDLLTIEEELAQELGTKVDLVLKSNLKPSLSRNILAEVEYL